MPATTPRPPSSEQVAAFDRTAWSRSIGIHGRYPRNPHLGSEIAAPSVDHNQQRVWDGSSLSIPSARKVAGALYWLLGSSGGRCSAMPFQQLTRHSSQTLSISCNGHEPSLSLNAQRSFSGH